MSKYSEKERKFWKTFAKFIFYLGIFWLIIGMWNSIYALSNYSINSIYFLQSEIEMMNGFLSCISGVFLKVLMRLDRNKVIE